MNNYRFHLTALLLTGLQIALPPASAAGPSKIAGTLQPFVDRHALAGAVTLVLSKDKVLDLAAVGWADIAAKKPMHTDSIFWIASQSKPMTGTALMMLVDEGRIILDDPVEKYLPEFKGQTFITEQDNERTVLQKPAHPITVRNVLSHTSGLPFMSRAEPRIDMFPLGVSVLAAALSPLKFEPGTRYDYSNAGINTAGRIIEVISGMPYEEFMDRRLIRPLGMKDTTFWPSAAQLERLAKSYKPNSDKTGLEKTDIAQLTYPLTSRRRGPSPAGGYFSTASDIGRFCQMILNGGKLDGKRYLSEAAVTSLTSKQTGDLPQGYGFGWATGDGWCGHGGAYATNMTIDTRRGLITVWMVQADGFPGDGERSRDAFKQAAIEQFGSFAGK